LKAKHLFFHGTWTCVLFAGLAFGQSPALRITIDQAIRLALQHNHNLLAMRTTVNQSEAQEITANVRPNPIFFADWEYLPLFSQVPQGVSTSDYLQGSTEGDIGISYLFERGQKRQHRVQAAKDATEVVRSQVGDNERTLGFQVGALFINVQVAEATIDFAGEDLASFQKTVEIAQSQFEFGGMSENDNLKIKLQLLQFQQTLQQAQLARIQALDDLRQAVGYESVPANYDVAGLFEYRPFPLSLDSLYVKAMENRPDLRASIQGITAANSQHALARANSKQDVTLSLNYSHVNGISGSTFYVAVPIPIFDRNQGNIAATRYAITQAEEQKRAVEGQAMTDVRDAYEALQSNDRVVQFYRSGNLDTSKKSRDISEYAYQRGATSLLDFLDAQRSYRATQVGYVQGLAAYLTSIEQVRQAVGTRSLP
jgi:cobalt-zinc-cadmium efflux system outer membrane protein